MDSWLSFKGIEKPPEKKVKGAPAPAPAPAVPAVYGGGKAEKKEKKEKKKMNKFSPIGFRPPKTKPESR